RPDRVVGPVFPGLAEELEQAQKINIVSRDASYRIARIEGGGWAMIDRGDFPVNARRLAQLTDGLRELVFVRRMSSDPAQHERLGVGDPTQGGSGILVQLENARGGFIANLILGVTREATYARRPGENQVWAVRGELPPLRDPAAWLELTPLAVQGRDIRRVETTPRTGPAYVLERASADADFAFAGAAASRTPISAATLTSTAERLTALQPIDVLPAAAVTGAPVASIRATLASGALIAADFFALENRLWIRLNATGAEGPAQAAAAQINARSARWAYALSQAEFDALAPTLDALTMTSAPAEAPALP
ncbi:MAG: DUF4340 domain-containing protein, partial [Hyphomonadaceae bacterium]